MLARPSAAGRRAVSEEVRLNVRVSEPLSQEGAFQKGLWGVPPWGNEDGFRLGGLKKGSSWFLAWSLWCISIVESSLLPPFRPASPPPIHPVAFTSISICHTEIQIEIYIYIYTCI